MTNLLDLITPTNLLNEKDKFFGSSTYNPLFHYIWQDEKMEPNFAVPKKYSLWQAISNQDNGAITAAAADLFEVSIEEKEIKVAHADAKQKGKVSEGNAKMCAALMRQTLDSFDLRDYDVEIVEVPGFNSRPQHADKKLLISSYIHFEYFSVEGLVHHELTHILRYHNGKHNKIKRSLRFLPTEEGLASWCQDNAGDNNGRAQHAMEYIASAIGMKGSLRDVYEALRDMGMSAELAWKRACRHKFGFVHTGKPGDIMKPAMYYDNELKIDKLSTDERVRLYVGKIHQDELPAYSMYSGLWPAEKIIEYFSL